MSDLSTKAKTLVDNPHADVRSFTLTLSQSAGTKRGQGRGSFVNSVTGLVDTFYAEVVQHLKGWTPSAPRVKAKSADGIPVVEGLVVNGPHAASADALTPNESDSRTVAELVSAKKDVEVSSDDTLVQVEDADTTVPAGWV